MPGLRWSVVATTKGDVERARIPLPVPGGAHPERGRHSSPGVLYRYALPERWQSG